MVKKFKKIFLVSFAYIKQKCWLMAKMSND